MSTIEPRMIRAVAFTAPGEFSLIDRRRPVPTSTETLVAPRFVGICATDLELLEATHPYFRHGLATHPLQPGHEWSGVVLESSDPSFPTGTRVVGDPEVPCGRADRGGVRDGRGRRRQGENQEQVCAQHLCPFSAVSVRR